MSISKLLSLIILIAVLQSCSEEQDITETNTEPFYRCESGHHSTLSERQYSMQDDDFQFMSPCEAENGINVFFESCSGTPYEDAIPGGMEKFNEAPIGVNFNVVDDIGDADIVIECSDEGWCCGCANAAFPDPDNPGDRPPNGQTFFPSGGSVGSGIALDTGPSDCECSAAELDQCFYEHTVMHELMHTLGFHHNDVNPNTPGATHVAGTATGYDPGSVINSGPSEPDFCDGSCEFNNNDIKALQSLYPQVSINGPEVLCLGEQGKFCLPNSISGSASIHWSVNGQVSIKPNIFSPLGPAISKFSNCYHFSSLQPGEHTITAWINDGECSYSVSTTITVHELEDCKICYCECLLESQWGDIEYLKVERDCDEDCSSIEEFPQGNFYVEYCEETEEVKPDCEETCPPGFSCVNGNCVDPCSGVVCPTNWTCNNGNCTPPPPHPCDGVICPKDAICVGGVCQFF